MVKVTRLNDKTYIISDECYDTYKEIIEKLTTDHGDKIYEVDLYLDEVDFATDIEEDCDCYNYYNQESVYTIPLVVINKVCGWEKFCEVTGTNEWCINEGYECDSFDVKESHAKELGLV